MKTKKWSFGSYLFIRKTILKSTITAKSSSEQVAILADAGNDTTLMIAPRLYSDIL
jgi:hypothetical protein